MAKMLFIAVLILLTFYSKATKQKKDSNARQDMTSHHVHELYPRVCGMHGWKKCRRRRSSVKVLMTFNITKGSILVAINAS